MKIIKEYLRRRIVNWRWDYCLAQLVGIGIGLGICFG
jgi:hypothetical protein